MCVNHGRCMYVYERESMRKYICVPGSTKIRTYLQECVYVLVLVCQKEKDRGEIERKTVFRQSD